MERWVWAVRRSKEESDGARNAAVWAAVLPRCGLCCHITGRGGAQQAGQQGGTEKPQLLLLVLPPCRHRNLSRLSRIRKRGKLDLAPTTVFSLLFPFMSFPLSHSTDAHGALPVLATLSGIQGSKESSLASTQRTRDFPLLSKGFVF